MIGLEIELLIKIGLIMKKKVMRNNMFGRKANGVQKVLQEARKERCNATETKSWNKLKHLVDLKCGVLSKQLIEGNHWLIFKWLFYCRPNSELQWIKKFT